MDKGMASTPVFLPGEFHGQRSLAGYSPWGSQNFHFSNLPVKERPQSIANKKLSEAPLLSPNQVVCGIPYKMLVPIAQASSLPKSPFQFLKESSCCSPQCLYQFTFPPTVQEGSLFSTPSPVFIICRLFDNGCSDLCEVIAQCSFDLQFSTNQQCSASFHVQFGHLYVCVVVVIQSLSCI